jgi:PAS domain S-box-containing protein
MRPATAGTLVDALSRALIRVAPSAVMTLDTAGRVTSMNAPAENLFSATAETALGQSYQAVLGPSVSDRLLGLFLRTARDPGGLEPHLVRATLPDGRKVELRANIGPIRDAAGKADEILLVAEEVLSQQAAASETTERLRLALRRYVGDELAAMIEQRPSFIGVGGVRRRVSLVHADMRGYTTLAEVLEPEEATLLLLKYHGRAVEALHSAGATLDRFIGDSVLAIWNAPNEFESHAAGSLHGALALQKASKETGSELAYGIGVHTGDVVVGNIGSGRYINYTAVGDAVNVAARLQAEARPGQVLCSAQVLKDAGGSFQARSLGALQMRGRTEPVETLELLGYGQGEAP